ncbi:hypothetical protein CPJCM30710_02720 [Clostridium polyendosporum]|uniref:PIN domain-containing protein n=1 Tax=Clostridium polyendosporum TaxID=69208 RepID=A0A919RWC8_9CLOT|nr:hypothetical protein [Clostridium polyendosporum]GIM27606.1 hypothetical protein CPJCM30710_02720 [Clostridium polyendosporum]
MVTKEYLLDTNIVIRVWNKYPNLFDNIEKSEGIDFKISQDIAEELSRKEFREYNGVAILTDKFIKLLGHIINNSIYSLEEDYKTNEYIKYKNNNNIYLVNGDKISVNDYNLIHICEIYKQYILVTEDKKLFKSAKLLLNPSQVLTFNQFIDDLKNLEILYK